MRSAAVWRMEVKKCFLSTSPSSQRHNASARFAHGDETLDRAETKQRFWRTLVRDAGLRTRARDVRRGERGVVDEVDNLVSKSAENPR